MTVPNASSPPTPIGPTGIARRLDAAVNMIDLVRNDGNAALRDLPQTAPLFSVVDLVTALGHLRQAAILLDGVADTLESSVVKR